MQRLLLRFGAEAMGQPMGFGGYCFKGEVGPDLGGWKRLAITSPSQSSRRGFWCREGREIRSRSQLP